MFVTHYGKKLKSLPLLNIMEEALFEKGENAVFCSTFLRHVFSGCWSFHFAMNYCVWIFCRFLKYSPQKKCFWKNEPFLLHSSLIWWVLLHSFCWLGSHGQMWLMTWPTKGKDKYKEKRSEWQMIHCNQILSVGHPAKRPSKPPNDHQEIDISYFSFWRQNILSVHLLSF